ncbi:MAG: cytochrome c-type biogenesis protein [Myxococcota bacterium]
MILAALLSLAIAAGPDPAALLGPPAGPPLTGEALRSHVYRTGKLLRCVVCQGLSVADSPSETAQAMRDEVEALAAQGYDTEQILFYFETSYGEFVRLEPKPEGWNLLVWALPLGFLAVGAGLVARGVRKGTPAAPAPAEDEDPYLRRVREETR